SMHLLTASQTPLVEALNLVEKMISFYPMEAALPHIRNGILQGEALHASLARFPVFNKRMVSLIKVAEEVNQLDMIFEKLSHQYSDEVEHQTGMIGSVIEPIMIIFIAVFVGFILIAMYLPLFELSTTIG
ncbi:MAG: type II secretion system F family protein, partial [Bacteroidota bacterium]